MIRETKKHIVGHASGVFLIKEGCLYFWMVIFLFSKVNTKMFSFSENSSKFSCSKSSSLKKTMTLSSIFSTTISLLWWSLLRRNERASVSIAWKSNWGYFSVIFRALRLLLETLKTLNRKKPHPIENTTWNINDISWLYPVFSTPLQPSIIVTRMANTTSKLTHNASIIILFFLLIFFSFFCFTLLESYRSRLKSAVPNFVLLAEEPMLIILFTLTFIMIDIFISSLFKPVYNYNCSFSKKIKKIWLSVTNVS